ncbi:MAG: hypothetical protein PHD32_08480 [Eubacteriales bacterium]|nr:hypothetical protein [Eubacteriales bacterium]
MKKKYVALLLALVLLSVSLISGCSNVKKMVTGQWQLAGMTDSTGKMSESTMTIVVEIFEDGSVNLLDGYYGNFTIDRNNFKFEGRDGDVFYSGSFDVNADELYVYLDQRELTLYFTRPDATASSSATTGTSTN